MRTCMYAYLITNHVDLLLKYGRVKKGLVEQFDKWLCFGDGFKSLQKLVKI